MSLQNRLVGQGDILASLVAMPFAVLGLVWLVLATDVQTILMNWQKQGNEWKLLSRSATKL